jgi:hypothetical protein
VELNLDKHPLLVEHLHLGLMENQKVKP